MDESPIRELAKHEVPHCAAPWSPIQAGSFAALETLPYHDLEGPGLERLCFQILLSQGYEPRFFGRSGQRDFAVDLVAEKDGKTEVYQCKNLRAPPTAANLRKYLDKFQREWLGEAGLPRPQRFVICCPQLLRDSEIDRRWIKAKKGFWDSTGGVEAGLWHLDLFNGWLRRLPDIVADLFSDRHAEAFCDIDDWKPDLFIPLREGASGDPRLKRYFEHLRTGRLYVDPGYEQKITEALERSPVILVRGLPGAGKTFTSLAVAEGFRGGGWRTYFLDVGDDEMTKGQMKDGVDRRLTRPSLFVFENCHENLNDVEKALRALEPELKSGRAKVICLTRRVPGSEKFRSDDSDLFAEIELQGAMVEFENDDKLLKRVIEFWRPEFKGLSKARLAKLGALCGRDLLLLDEMLREIASASEIDGASPRKMYDSVRRAYFGRRTADDLVTTRRLAALAQFELRPRADVVKFPDDELAVINSLCVRAGCPPRWHFLHPTGAELILHALWSGMGESDAAEVATLASQNVIDYFRDVQTEEVQPVEQLAALERNLVCVMSNHLKLAEEDAQRRLKAAVLDSAPVKNLLLKIAGAPTYPQTVALCAFVAHRTGAASAQAYAQQLRDTIVGITKACDAERLAAALPFLGAMMRCLKLAGPTLHQDLSEALDEKHLLDLIEANGTVFELFRIAPYAPPPLARKLIEALDEGRVEGLIQKTIATGRSIGTLDLALRTLLREPETAGLGKALEAKIGPARFLKLIEANGTIFELFMFVKHSSPALARALIEALDEGRVEGLIQKTIAAGRSIGTLDLALRKLHRDPETAALGEALEEKIGPARFLKLIEANGTIFELFMIVEHSSPALARGLIEALDEERVEGLIQKTIATGRSIGTLHLALRELLREPATDGLGKALEERVGPARFLKLIEANGTIFELFMIVKHSSPALARGLIEALDEGRVEGLIQKTIATGRPIGTLNLTLRELRTNTVTAVLAEHLEHKVGTGRWWRLMVGTGSPGPLVDLLRDMGSKFRGRFLRAARDRSEDEWRQLLGRGDLFQLCELISQGAAVFENDAGGAKLLTAVRHAAPSIAASSDWYERNTGAKRLAECPESPARDVALQALDGWLAQLQVERVSFPCLCEAVNGLELLYERRRDLRPLLAARLWKLLPPPERWKLDPKKDMGLPRLLLRLVAQNEFSVPDAEHVAVELMRCLTPQVIAKSRTVDILWTLWALFAFTRQRTGVAPAAFGRSLPLAFVQSIKESLATRAEQKGDQDELRARFALLGLLALIDCWVDSSVIAALGAELGRRASAGAWWLSADQTFVTVYLVLRAVETAQPFSARQKADFLERLVITASEYPEIDPAAQCLLSDVHRQKQELESVHSSVSLCTGDIHRDKSPGHRSARRYLRRTP